MIKNAIFSDRYEFVMIYEIVLVAIQIWYWVLVSRLDLLVIFL
jgi:hypothetical protein